MSRIDQKLQTRQRILDGAGRGFRKGGFGGIGVDGLANEAGVTSGAFYVHFGSKADAFCQSIVAGLNVLNEGLQKFQRDYGKQWWPRFVHFYLNEGRDCHLTESCVLPWLTSDVVRADANSRAAFEAGILEVAKTVANGPASRSRPPNIEAACAALAMLLGGVTLARAVNDPVLSQTISNSVERSLLPMRQRAM